MKGALCYLSHTDRGIQRQLLGKQHLVPAPAEAFGLGCWVCACGLLDHKYWPFHGQASTGYQRGLSLRLS